MAELSNPFLICRTVLRILGKKETTLYKVNEILFAAVFIILWIIFTPMFLIYMFEGHNVLYSIKLGVSFILYVQLFWGYRIIFIIFEMLRDPYAKKDKDAPILVELGYQTILKVEKDKKIRMGVTIINFIVIFVLPHLYYGMVVGNLKVNLVYY